MLQSRPVPEARESDKDDDLERLRAVVRANPRSTTFVALAHALCDAGKDDEAEDVCRQGLAQHPRLTTGQVALGRALLARKRLREAQEVLVEAAKSSPEHGDAFRWLGEVVLERGDRDRARIILEYAEELSPSATVVGALLTRAGGNPLPRAVRPKTDFEHTRVGDARALAQRMHEDPPQDSSVEGEERSTPVVDGRKLDEPAPPPGLGATAAELRARAEARGRDQTRDPAHGRAGEQTEPETIPFPPPEPGGRRDSEAGVTAAPGPGASGPLAAPLDGGLLGRWRRSPPALRYGGPAVVVVGVLALAVGLRSDDPQPPPVPQASPVTPPEAPPVPLDFLPAIDDGGLERLQEARARGKQIPPGRAADADALAQLAMVNALLASEHGQPTVADATEVAEAAEKLVPPTPARRALLEGARALVALAGGRLPEAQAAGQRAVEAGVAPLEAEASRLAHLARGRVKHLRGEVEAAAEDLEIAARGGAGRPRLALAVLARAALTLDTGEAAVATTLLEELTAARKDLLSGRLLLAEARRAVSAPAPAEDLQKDCREQGRESPVLRSQCAVEGAVANRLAGDRAAALKAARVAVAASRRQVQVNARAVAQGALVLVSLGDVDGASDALRRIREETEPAFPPRAQAELAVAFSRGEPMKDMKNDQDARVLARPGSPDARLLAARMALARGGPKELAAHLGDGHREALAQDPDLRFLASLTEEGKLDPDLRKQIAQRSDQGSSLASYVLGRHELAAGNKKAAAQWLALALKGHGDTCEAARLLLSIEARDRPSALRQTARVARVVRGRNGGCLHVRAP
jgi:tetratricopeptide (TPR) repeat protein